MSRYTSIWQLSIILLLASFTVAGAQDFSIDKASPEALWLEVAPPPPPPTVWGFDPADIMRWMGTPYPNTPPRQLIWAEGLGLVGQPPVPGRDELDAFSYGIDNIDLAKDEPVPGWTTIFFSVDRPSIGIPAPLPPGAGFAVWYQTMYPPTANGAAGDKSRITFPGGVGASALHSNAPWHWLSTTAASPESDLDGMSRGYNPVDSTRTGVYFSLDALTAATYYASSGADIFYQPAPPRENPADTLFVPPPAPVYYARYFDLGLLDTVDIDALLIWDAPPIGPPAGLGDRIWVSFARGACPPTAPCPAAVYEVWLNAAVVPPLLVIPAVSMDLVTMEDNLNALATLHGYPGNAAALTAFNAVTDAKGVVVSWEYQLLDANNAGFNLYRGMSESDNFKLLNADGPIVGGNPLEFVDEGVEPGFTYWYELGAVDLDGNEELLGRVSCYVGPRSVSKYELLGCYPNPTDGSTMISYRMDVAGQVEVSIFDSKGRLVREYVRAESPGTHELAWDGRDGKGRVVHPGTYFYKVRIGDWEASKKVTVVP